MSTSSREDSRVRTCPPPESARDSRTVSAADCGASSRESFAWYDPATSSWRTLQGSFQWSSDAFSGTWPRSGSMRNGRCSAHPTQAPRTDASESSFSPWPTPNAHDHGNRGTISDPCIRRRADLGKQLDLSMLMEGALNPDWVEALMGFPAGFTRSK